MNQVKIQFCSGGNRLEGWENRDMDCDITKHLPYPDNYADMVFCEHGAEHISGPDCLRFFEGVQRILKPGGVFRVCIPVLDRLNRQEAMAIIKLHGHLTIWNTELIRDVLFVAGFGEVELTDRRDCDGHFRVIGKEQDDKETARFEAVK